MKRLSSKNIIPIRPLTRKKNSAFRNIAGALGLTGLEHYSHKAITWLGRLRICIQLRVYIEVLVV
jgi:hypothetical protein